MSSVSKRSLITMASLLGLAVTSPITGGPFQTRDGVVYSNVSAGSICGDSGPQAASGQAIIDNTCNFPVYLQSVDGSATDTVITLLPGNTYKELYHIGPSGGGVAIKLTKNESDWTTPMLLEYAPNLKMQQVFYDMSVSVGGQGKGDGGIGLNYKLTPSATDGSCVAVAYANSYIHLGESDAATKSCPMTTSLTLSLC